MAQTHRNEAGATAHQARLQLSLRQLQQKWASEADGDIRAVDPEAPPYYIVQNILTTHKHEDSTADKLHS